MTQKPKPGGGRMPGGSGARGRSGARNSAAAGFSDDVSDIVEPAALAVLVEVVGLVRIAREIASTMYQCAAFGSTLLSSRKISHSDTVSVTSPAAGPTRARSDSGAPLYGGGGDEGRVAAGGGAFAGDAGGAAGGRKAVGMGHERGAGEQGWGAGVPEYE